MQKAYIVLAVLFILLVLIALVVAWRGPQVRAAALGGAALAARARGRKRGGSGPELGHHHPRDLHPVGVALERYARALGPEHVVAVHPLDRDRYEPLARGGTGGDAKPRTPKKRAPAPPPAQKRWTEYATWKELQADEGATAEYFAQRAEAINSPEFDWGPVLREILPRLAEGREYIGLVDAEEDGKTLRLKAYEASPIEAGKTDSETTFAAVPAELVTKYAERPALFMFHTHPADPRGSPLPSSHDLSTAAYFAATGRYAASVVISRYGVLIFTLDWSGYKAVNEAKDWSLALSNLSHDIVASHEAVRSWSAHSLADYLAFYPRHRLFFAAYPSPEMVADGRRYTYIWNLETPIDHELITEHREEIAKHRERLKGQKVSRVRDAPIEADLGLD